MLLLLLLCCCCCVFAFFCFGGKRKESVRNLIITMEDDASGAMAHRRMVQTGASGATDVHTAYGASDAEATFNPAVRNAGGAAPRAPTRGSVAVSTPNQTAAAGTFAQREHTAYV